MSDGNSNLRATVGACAVLGGVTVNGVVIRREISFPDYEGDYQVTPRPEAFALPTQERTLRQDLTVRAIPYFTTTNLSGGYTAIIGG